MNKDLFIEIKNVPEPVFMEAPEEEEISLDTSLKEFQQVAENNHLLGQVSQKFQRKKIDKKNCRCAEL